MLDSILEKSSMISHLNFDDNDKMTKINFSLTTSFNWWKKATSPVSAAVLTASKFKDSKPFPVK